MFARPMLPAAPKRLLLAVAGAGVVAAFALPYSAPGTGVLLVAVALGVAVISTAREKLTPHSAVFGLIALVLAAMAVFRDAAWLTVPLFLVALGFGSLAVAGGRSWAGLAKGVTAIIPDFFLTPLFIGRPIQKLVGGKRVRPVLAGAALTILLLLVFGVLLSSADAVFSTYVERAITAPDWMASAPLRIFLFVLFTALSAGFVLAALRPVKDAAEPRFSLRASRLTWFLPLTALNLLFAAFVAVQLTVLFGGNRRVLETAGLTYAEYARSGFFQLTWVSLIVLAIVAFAGGALRLEGADKWLMAGQLGILSGLTIVILISAVHRLGLYTDAYGLSRLRSVVWFTNWWLAAIFALVLIAGAVRLARSRPTPWLPRALAVMTGVGLVAFAIWNPDLRVAETSMSVRGIERLDEWYLGTLGADAVPALDRLPEPTRSCVLDRIARGNDLDRADPWNGWNLSREQARLILAERPPNATCP